MQWYITAIGLELVKFRMGCRPLVVCELHRWLRGQLQQRQVLQQLLCAVLSGHHGVIFTRFFFHYPYPFLDEGIPALREEIVERFIHSAHPP